MNEVEDLKELEELKKIVLKRILSKQAFERLARIKLVKPEIAAQLELYLLQLYQQNKIKKEISDNELKLILQNLTSKKEFKIIK